MFQQLKVPSSKRFRSRGVSYYKICKPLQSYNSKSFRSFFVAGSDLCLSVAKFQVTRVSEVFWLQILIRSWIAIDFRSCIALSSQIEPISHWKFEVTRVLEYPSLKLWSNSKFRSFESFKCPKLQIHTCILPYLQIRQVSYLTSDVRWGNNTT